MPTPTPIALSEARAKGETHYFTGIPCKHGHLSKRSVRSNICLECQRGWQKARRANHPEEFQIIDRRRNYGLEQAQYEQMMKDQDESCAICFTPFGDTKSTKPHVDHDHTSGEVRGLLCTHCNLVLGHAKDNPETLLRAISYLER